MTAHDPRPTFHDPRIVSPEQPLDTPALVVDRAIMQRNLEEMAALARSFGVKLRPHIKTHKTPEIAQLQLATGAVGIMCAKLSEAEVMADGGVIDIAIGNQIVGELKLQRLVQLSKRARLTVAVDSLAAARAMGEAFAATGGEIAVYLEVDTGHRRAGVLPEDAPAMAMQIAAMPGLRLYGVMTHEGLANAQPKETIEQFALEAGRTLVSVAETIRAAGVQVQEVSVGSTPAAHITPTVPGVTEMRPGTYVFKDVNMFRYGIYGPDRCAARIVATVTSRPATDRAVIDAGSKTVALDLNPGHPGHGCIVGHPNAIIDRISEEHGVVILSPDEPGFAIGERLEIIPNHICPAVNLHDHMLVLEEGTVVGAWSVAARGRVQ